MDMKQIMLDIGCDSQSALNRAFRSAHMDISDDFLTRFLSEDIG